MAINWDRWIGNLDGQPVYFQKKLASWMWRGQRWTLRLHKFVKVDNAGCFHTHPAHALRIVLWGGYAEEVLLPSGKTYIKGCGPGYFGRVTPEYCHRIEAFLFGRTSWSLWFHGPKVASIELHGDGWPDDLRHRAGEGRVFVKPLDEYSGSNMKNERSVK